MPKKTTARAEKFQEGEYENVVADVKKIIEKGRQEAYGAVNAIMTMTYWSVGRRIVEEEQEGQGRAQYGKQLIKVLSERLTVSYGSGYSERYLAYFRKFYLTVPQEEILQTRLQNLTWSHYLTSLRVDDEVARRWYLENASHQNWSVKQLDRNISTQYYERHYAQPRLASEAGSSNRLEILKTPIMAELI